MATHVPSRLRRPRAVFVATVAATAVVVTAPGSTGSAASSARTGTAVPPSAIPGPSPIATPVSPSPSTGCSPQRYRPAGGRPRSRFGLLRARGTRTERGDVRQQARARPVQAILATCAIAGARSGSCTSPDRTSPVTGTASDRLSTATPCSGCPDGSPRSGPGSRPTTGAARRLMLFIVTTDHGGAGRRHDNPVLRTSYQIPFIAWGSMTASGEDIYDEAPPSYRDPDNRRDPRRPDEAARPHRRPRQPRDRCARPAARPRQRDRQAAPQPR